MTNRPTNRKRWNVRRDSKTGHVRVKPTEQGWRDALDITITSVEYSRNGVSGEGFYTALFTVNGPEGEFYVGHNFIAMVMDDNDPDGPFYNCSTGVIDLTAIEEDGGLNGNTWRGDHFDHALRYGIERWCREEDKQNGWPYYKRFDGVNSNRRNKRDWKEEVA